MQNGKTIKTRKNVDFNVDIFIRPCFVKYELHLYEKYAKIYTSCSGKAFRQTNNEILFALHQRARSLTPGFLVCVKVCRLL